MFLQIYLRYLLDYPLGKKLRSHLDFVVSQLPYEHEAGRESVLEMLAYIFQTFPQVRELPHAGTKLPSTKKKKTLTRVFFLHLSAQNLLLQHSGLFFAPLALVVINDASARCKKMAALAIKELLARLNADHQNSLFKLVNTWLNAEKVFSVSSVCSRFQCVLQSKL